MDTSPRLGLPFIAPQQAQKHISFNEAIRVLDTLVQPAVMSRTTATPPGSPASGEAYIVAPSATGAWAGKDGEVASYADGGWDFITPADGWLAFVGDTAEIAICQSGLWSALVTNGGTSIAKFGINATADLTNRLAIAAAASLFTHDGSGHQLKINKSAAGDTASVLFQQSFTGHAEFGLAGDNDFHVKVSPDGIAWHDALKVAASNGALALQSGQLGFPATPNLSSNPNTLDHYEEGTFTPRIDGTTVAGTGTYALQSGAYTRIGNVVVAAGVVSITAHTGTGNMVIANLPLTQGVSAPLAVASLRVNNLTHGGGAVVGYVSGSTIILETEASGSAPVALPIDTSFSIRFSATYFV
jgi:hypothetical protein